MADPECARGGGESHILAEKRGVSFTLFKNMHENSIFSPITGGGGVRRVRPMLDPPLVADEILNGKITKNEIYFALRKVKKGKTAGIDGFPVELITEGKNYFMPFLEILFNSIFESGVYPDTWVSGLITPIHKKGDKLNPENLPALRKLFEIVLENRLTYINEVCCDNDQFQAGFKANCRTSDNIFILYSLAEHPRKYKKKHFMYAI